MGLTRVVYVSYIPLTAKLARDWYLDHLLESPFVRVEFWDITYLLRGEVAEHYQQPATYVREFRTLALLAAAITEQADAIFVLLFPKNWKFRAVFRLLTRHDCKTVIVKWGAMPVSGSTSRAGMLSLLSSPRVLLSKLRNRIHGFILTRSWYIKPYDLVFAAGEVMLSRPESARRTVPIGLCDVDQYLRSMHSERLINEKYAVFLDVYLPFHSDLALVGMPSLDPDGYYADLHRLFSVFEREQGVKVVIAAHPKARYINDEFRGRKVIYEKTATLVRDAQFVICHASTSISFAVLGRKPAFIIYTEEMEALYRQNYMRHVRAVAAYLQLPLLNASRADDAAAPVLKQPSEDRYAAYQKDFLVTPRIEGGQSKEIFLREILALSEVHSES